MRLPSNECPHCGAELPGLHAFARRGAECGDEPRPRGLWFAMLYSMAAAAAGSMMLVARPEFVDAEGRVLTGFAAELLPLAFFLATLPGVLSAYGLWNHRAWSRSLLVGWLIWMHVVLMPVVAAALSPIEAGMGLAFSVVFVPLVVLYLYANASVAGYYAAIARRDQGNLVV